MEVVLGKAANVAFASSLKKQIELKTNNDFQQKIFLIGNLSETDEVKKNNEYPYIVVLDERGGGTEEVYRRSFDTIRAKKIHLVVNERLGMVVYPEKRFDVFDNEDAVKNFAEIIAKRSATRFPKSMQISNSFDIPEKQFKEMQDVGSALFAMGLLPGVENGTYGNLSVRIGGSLLITGRNVNKGALNKNDVCLIENVRPLSAEQDRRVYAIVDYRGQKKPSIDSAIHNFVYDEIACGAMLHVHTERMFYGHPLTTFNYPCGTEKEKSDVLAAFTQKNEGVVQLIKHGLLVAGETLTACLDKLNDLYENEISIEKLDASKEKHVRHEWAEHLKEVYPRNAQMFEKSNKLLVVKVGSQSCGILFLDVDGDSLRFSLFTVEEFQKKNIGIGRKVVAILENVAKSQDKSELQLMTTEKCGVVDYYKNKNGFQIKEVEADGLIIMSRKL